MLRNIIEIGIQYVSKTPTCLGRINSKIQQIFIVFGVGPRHLEETGHRQDYTSHLQAVAVFRCEVQKLICQHYSTVISITFQKKLHSHSHNILKAVKVSLTSLRYSECTKCTNRRM